MFNPKYPYEYLDDTGAASMQEKLVRAEAFYRERGMME
jgi:hypothetical protein